MFDINQSMFDIKQSMFKTSNLCLISSNPCLISTNLCLISDNSGLKSNNPCLKPNSLKFLARPNTMKGGSWYFEMAKDSWGIQSTQLGFGETHIHTKLSIASTTFLKGLQPKFEKFLPRFSLCQTKRLKSFILLLQFEKKKDEKKICCRAHHQSFSPVR